MQFGSALQRLLQRLAYCNPALGPPLLAKIDVADGYYRVLLSPAAALHLAVCLPPDASREPLLEIPLSLPMGWSLSHPYFCAFTETCADLSNAILPVTPTHPYATAVQPQAELPTPSNFHPLAQFPYNPSLPRCPLAYTDVYIDDFLLLAQCPCHTSLMHKDHFGVDCRHSHHNSWPARVPHYMALPIAFQYLGQDLCNKKRLATAPGGVAQHGASPTKCKISLQYPTPSPCQPPSTSMPPHSAALPGLSGLGHITPPVEVAPGPKYTPSPAGPSHISGHRCI